MITDRIEKAAFIEKQTTENQIWISERDRILLLIHSKRNLVDERRFNVVKKNYGVHIIA